MRKSTKNISFVIPVQNESVDLAGLVIKINKCLSDKKDLRRCRTIDYEIIIVTDNPENPTIQRLTTEKYQVAVRVYIVPKQSRAQLCAIGFSYAKHEILTILEGTQLYSYATFLKLIKRIGNTAGVIILLGTNEKNRKRQAGDQELFTIMTDPHSLPTTGNMGMNTFFFTKQVWQTIHFTPFSDTMFLLEFMHRSREAGFLLEKFILPAFGSIEKQSWYKTVANGVREYVQLRIVRLVKINPQQILPSQEKSMINAGLAYKKQQYITHTTLTHNQSAIESIKLNQLLAVFILLEIVSVGFFLNAVLLFQIIVGIISSIYLIDIIFNAYLAVRTIRSTQEIRFSIQEIESVKTEDLPFYSILCPLYKEAHIVKQFIDGITKLDWPKEKLDVIFLLEEDDRTSIERVTQMHLPSFVRTLIVPPSLPKTKPKACNYGLHFAKGEYVVIFDAEDIPDPLQLKKAYLGFQTQSEDIFCLQAKLNYYNASQNLLTRFFTAEYALWFDVILTGLQSIHTIIPLGGTSNHFRTKDLKKLSAWDPFNVTEDADLGMRLFKLGYKTAIIDSVTLEEANSQVNNWIRQRSRWIKGYMQTYLVHSRDLLQFTKKRGVHALIFQLIIGGRIAFLFINPVLWIVTLSYFTLHGMFRSQIDILYSPAVLYIAITSLIFGNSLYLFCYMLGCIKKEQWWLIKYVYLIPFYWLLMSVSGCVALYQLLFKPHYWEKTLHGLHLKTKKTANVEKSFLSFALMRIGYRGVRL